MSPAPQSMDFTRAERQRAVEQLHPLMGPAFQALCYYSKFHGGAGTCPNGVHFDWTVYNSSVTIFLSKDYEEDGTNYVQFSFGDDSYGHAIHLGVGREELLRILARATLCLGTHIFPEQFRIDYIENVTGYKPTAHEQLEWIRDFAQQLQKQSAPTT